MGRIKSTMVKRAAEQLMNKDAFSTSFEGNKVKLRNILPSTPIRNKVAGYIARLVRAQNAQKQKEAKPETMPVEQHV